VGGRWLRQEVRPSRARTRDGERGRADELRSLGRYRRDRRIRGQLALVIALTPVEVRVLGPAAPDSGRRPAPAKALLEFVRTAVVAAVVVGLARTLDLCAVGSTLLLGLVLWVGFP
jgi:hypothetical protein